MPPFTNTDFRDKIRWSEWMESIRENVEFAFGILKMRWRILKTGVCLHSTKVVDQVWIKCCAFHNMLLDIDGLDDQWDGRQVNTSEW